MGRRHYLLPFTPHYDFVAERPMTIEGVALDRGDLVPKDKLGERRLRQMYEQRKIAPAPFGEGPAPAFLNNGIGKADQLAAELAKEEARDEAARVSAAPRRADAAKPAAAAEPPAAKSVAPKRAASRKPKRAA